MSGGFKSWVGKTFFDFAYGIIYRERKDSLICDLRKGGDERAFRILKPTLRYWYADPIALTFKGEEYVLCEVFDRKKHKGLIGCSKYVKGKMKRPEIILEEPFHLSFPAAFVLNGETYITPECSEAAQLRIYKLQDDLKPVLVRAFNLEEAVVDTATVVKKDEASGKEVMFFLTCVICSENPKKTSLRLYRLDDLEDGVLTEYPLAPEYREDSFFIRNGGPILTSDIGKIRILQESTQTEYGHNLIIRHIESMDENGLVEKAGRVIGLEDFALHWPVAYRKQGTHTYGFTDKMEVADISFNRFHVGNLWMKKKDE